MKKRDIENRLKSAASSARVPSDLEETCRLIKQIPQDKETLQTAPKKKAKWALPALGTVSAALVVGLAVGLAVGLPGSNPPGPTSSGQTTLPPLPPVTTTLDLKEATAFGRQAVSLLALASSFSEDGDHLAFRARRKDAPNDEGDGLSYQQMLMVANDIDDFIYMIEDFNGSDGWSIVLEASLTEIKIEDGEATYLIDYEEEVVSDTLTSFSGTIDYGGGKPLDFEGRVETEGDEREVVMILLLPNGERIEAEQEIEHGENEYSYSFYSGGNPHPYRTVSYEREIEGREGESSLEVQEGTTIRECEFEHLATSSEGMGESFRAEYKREDTSKDEELEAEDILINKLSETSHEYLFGETRIVLP